MNENFLWILSFRTVSVIPHSDAESRNTRGRLCRNKKSLYRRVGDTDSLWCEVCCELFAYLFECVFTKAANRANPIFGQILKGSAGSDATIGVTYCGVVNPLTCCANVLFHISLFFIKIGFY